MNETGGTSTQVAAYQKAESFVTGLIMGPPSPPPGSTPEEIRQRAIERIGRLSAFLEFLGNPHLQYPTIHIGGTSGKGSTTSLTASILSASGLRTGSHVSPYLQVSTEKLLIDGRPASAQRYAELVSGIQRSIEAWVARGNPVPTYGEVWVAMTFLYFAKEQVDVAVIEVGAGGRFDLTNVIQPRVVAITSIGFDHTVTLGNTLPEIAWHKAGIIKPGVTALTSVVDADALAVIQSEAELTGVELQIVHEGATYIDVDSNEQGTSFLDGSTGKRFHVPLRGRFQAGNAALAVSICRAFDDSAVSDDSISQGLLNTRFPGRMETVQTDPLVVLDGAHNPEKVSGMAAALRQVTGGRRLILVFGVLESKNYSEMWDHLEPLADMLIATAPKVLAKPPIPASEIAGLAGPNLLVETIDNPLDAIERALELASPDDAIIVTGSLYLVGNIREHWYPSAQILEQGTLWPEQRG